VARTITALQAQIQVSGRPVAKWSLAERMAHFHVPGVSIAVVDSGRIVWARGFGVKQAGTGDSVTAETIFQAASISKPVSATAMLKLVEQGKLSLDQNVNTYLKSWKVPDNKFTAKEKVTLRRIVSHSAGLTVHGFQGYAVTDPLPTIQQILNGVRPANSAAVRVDTFPGARWSYSGGGTTVMRLVLTDVTGEPFPELVKRLVLDPAGMSHSTFEQPLSAERAATAASGHGSDGTMVPGHWHIYPELAPDGLWTTPTDLLHWAMEIAADRAGKSDKLLSQSMATQMLTTQTAPTGLGPFLEGSGRGFRFGHGGDNVGFHADLVYFPETGQGAAIMTNGDQGQRLIGEIKLAIAAEYGWPDIGPRIVTTVPVDTVALERLIGKYVVTFGGQSIPIDITRDGDHLVVTSAALGGSEDLLAESPTSFVGSEQGYGYHFDLPATGQAKSIVVSVDELSFTAKRQER
jgi:CubicO group peptidase (beta-lactamase class C family)